MDETEPTRRGRDAVFECLAEQERRCVVRVVGEQGASTVDQLSAAIADVGRGTSSRSDRLELALHHTHLPKLADAGLVEYDADAQVVEPTERTSRALDHVEAVERACDRSQDARRTDGDRVRLDWSRGNGRT